jgi:putative nucleotidyltransferase with HDIG domain
MPLACPRCQTVLPTAANGGAAWGGPIVCPGCHASLSLGLVLQEGSPPAAPLGPEASRRSGAPGAPGAGLGQDRDPELAALRGRIQAVLQGDRDEIPLLNRVALKLRALMQDPRVHAAEVARLIHSDQALAARVIRLANSAYYGAFGPVADLGQAIRRVGFRAVEGVVVAASTQALYRPGTAAEAGLMSGLWDHALAVATAARQVVRDVRRGDSEQAFLAGLLHDVGRTLALRVLGEGRGKSPGERRVLPPERILRLIDAEHAEVGGRLLEKWEFPREVVLASRAHHSPAEVSDGETIPLAVALGNLVATRAGLDVSDLPPGAPPVEGLSQRLGLEASQLGAIEKEISQLHAEVK